MREVRKPKRENPKIFRKSEKKYSESIPFRQIAFEKFEIYDFLLIYRAFKL